MSRLAAVHLSELMFGKFGHLKGFMVKPQTIDIRVTYEYIRVTYGCDSMTTQLRHN